MLSLAEELILLGLRDETGTFSTTASTTLGYGLAGSMLLELTLRDTLRISNEILSVTNTKTDDPILNDLLNEIETSKKPRKIQHWFQRFTTYSKRICQPLLQRMVDAKILRQEEKRVLLLFPSKRYYIRKKKLKRALLERIKAVVFRRHTPEMRMVYLLSLILACNWIGILFEKDKRKVAKERIKEIIQKEIPKQGTAKSAHQEVRHQVTKAILESISNNANMTNFMMMSSK